MNRAQFQIVRSNPDYVLIEDLGPWDKYPTVTNDAEYVVRNLFQTGALSSSQKLLYIDSEGTTDQILHRDGKFMGYGPGGLPVMPG